MPIGKRIISARTMALLGAFVAPLGVAIFISDTFLAAPVVPQVVAVLTHSGYTAEALVTLSDKMMTVSGSVFLAAMWLFIQPVRRDRHFTMLLPMVFQAVTAFASLYSGLRFIFDMAMQINVIPLDFEPLRSRLYLQGACLLLQVCAICCQGVGYHFYRDRRHGMKGF